MRVVICWIGLSGYLTACWRALARREGIDLRVVVFHTVGNANAPFREDIATGFAADFLEEKYLEDSKRVSDVVAAHRPEVVVIAGWAIPAFNGLPFDPRLATARFIMGMDTPLKNGFRDRVRQKLARLKIGRMLSRMDRVIVAGERSWQYARMLGFSETQIRRGMYGVDVAKLESVHDRRLARPDGWPRRFLYMGRYVTEKGIDVLLSAYAEYRRQVTEPWPLTCCGSGALGGLMEGAAGVTNRGFVQPPDQPPVLEEHGAYVMASLFDPWPLAIVEACAAGLPVICTEACGSAVELIRPYWNGVMVATGDSSSLARGLRWVHEHQEELPEMGRRAREFARAYSAEVWAQRWMEMFGELLERGK